MSGDERSMDGGCGCGAVRYRLAREPLVVHACHCHYCQRETGSAFAINALIETSELAICRGRPDIVLTPSHSGKGQQIVRCPGCRVAVFSHYAGGGDAISFVRVGTLDTPSGFPPDIHIYTSSKLDWLVLPEGARSVPEFYRRSEVWASTSLERVAALQRA